MPFRIRRWLSFGRPVQGFSAGNNGSRQRQRASDKSPRLTPGKWAPRPETSALCRHALGVSAQQTSVLPPLAMPTYSRFRRSVSNPCPAALSGERRHARARRGVRLQARAARGPCGGWRSGSRWRIGAMLPVGIGPVRFPADRGRNAPGVRRKGSLPFSCWRLRISPPSSSSVFSQNRSTERRLRQRFC